MLLSRSRSLSLHNDVGLGRLGMSEFGGRGHHLTKGADKTSRRPIPGDLAAASSGMRTMRLSHGQSRHCSTPGYEPKTLVTHLKIHDLMMTFSFRPERLRCESVHVRRCRCGS